MPEGTPGAPMTYTVSGSNLVVDVTVTPPAGVEIRLLPGGTFDTTPILLTQSGGTLASTDIEVRIAASATAGQSFGPITHDASTTSADLTIIGTVTQLGGSGGGGDKGSSNCSTEDSPSPFGALLVIGCLFVLCLRNTRRRRSPSSSSMVDHGRTGPANGLQAFTP